MCIIALYASITLAAVWPGTRSVTRRSPPVTRPVTRPGHQEGGSTRERVRSAGAVIRLVGGSNPPAEATFPSWIALFACGYRIAGRSREERWRVLSEVAIPRLGRRQVIDTIESLIRLRESLHRDYSHTIGEWEYDLWRLRAPSFPFTPLHAGR